MHFDKKSNSRNFLQREQEKFIAESFFCINSPKKISKICCARFNTSNVCTVGIY